MKKVLLTGFEPFLSFPVNPTMEIVKALDGKHFGEYIVEGCVLPVAFEYSGKLILEKIREARPDVVVSMGLAAGRNKVTPERIAINVQDGEADNMGLVREDQMIEVDGEDGYFSTLPVRAIVQELIKQGLPAEISNSAGTYLCNNVMYVALHEAKQNNHNFRAGFIHIPASHELAIVQGKVSSWSQQDLQRAIEIALKVITHIEEK